MKIKFVKRKYWFEYPLFALQGLAGIIDGLIMFFSIGLLCSCLAIRVCSYRTGLFIKELIKEKNNAKKA